jgi:hypothetical protein
VVAGRLADGERLERRARGAGAAGAGFDTDAWGGYLLAKAVELTRRDHADEALLSLAELPAAWHRRPSFQRALADAARATGSDVLADGASARLAEMAVTPAGRWTDGPPPALEMVVPQGGAERAGGRAALQLRIEGERGGRRASLVEVRLDGRPVAAERLGRRRVLLLETAAAPGLHLLEVDTAAGDPFLPGSVHVDAPAAPPAPRTATRRQGAGAGGGAADDRQDETDRR